MTMVVRSDKEMLQEEEMVGMEIASLQKDIIQLDQTLDQLEATQSI